MTENINTKLLEALLGVKRDNCWCERGIGNPMLTSCTDACMRAKAIVTEIMGESDDYLNNLITYIPPDITPFT